MKAKSTCFRATSIEHAGPSVTRLRTYQQAAIDHIDALTYAA